MNQDLIQQVLHSHGPSKRLSFRPVHAEIVFSELGQSGVMDGSLEPQLHTTGLQELLEALPAALH